MAQLFKRSYLPYMLFMGGVVLIFVWAWARSSGARNEGFADADAPYKFNMYYVDWCPHCQTAKPEFAKLGSIQTIGGKRVEIAAIEAEKNPEQVLSKVSGYPTIHLYDPSGKLVAPYDGERALAGFQEFLDTQLSK